MTHNPSFDLLGSYFPSWMVCIALGILLAAGIRWIVRRLDWEHQLAPLVLIYPSIAVFFCFTLWLMFFGAR